MKLQINSVETIKGKKTPSSVFLSKITAMRMLQVTRFVIHNLLRRIVKVNVLQTDQGMALIPYLVSSFGSEVIRGLLAYTVSFR